MRSFYVSYFYLLLILFIYFYKFIFIFYYFFSKGIRSKHTFRVFKTNFFNFWRLGTKILSFGAFWSIPRHSALWRPDMSLPDALATPTPNTSAYAGIVCWVGITLKMDKNDRWNLLDEYDYDCYLECHSDHYDHHQA